VLVAALGGAAVVALALALAGRERLLGLALLALGSEIVALDAIRQRSAVVLVVCAAGLLTLGELATFALSLRAVELIERSLALRRCAHLAAIAAGGGAVAALVELATRIALRGGLASAVLGVGAVVLLLGLTSALARARRGPQREP
jgi:hypothetical protein